MLLRPGLVGIVLLCRLEHGGAGALGRLSARLDEEDVPQESLPFEGRDWDSLKSKMAAILDSAALRMTMVKDTNGQPGPGPPFPPAIQVQVSKKDLKRLSKELTTECSERFSDQMIGEGPEMSDFKGHEDRRKEIPECKKLNGSLCATQAKMKETKEESGREHFKEVKVEGRSCLPKECVDEDDLTSLAHFMRDRAQELLGSYTVAVELEVDCSHVGGGDIKVEDKKLKGKGDTAELPKSGAVSKRSVTATIALLVATALGFC